MNEKDADETHKKRGTFTEVNSWNRQKGTQKEGMHGRLMNEFPSKKIKWQNIYMLKTLVNQ